MCCFVPLPQAVGVFVARSHAEAPVTPAEIRAYVKKHVGGQSAPAWVWFLGEEGIPAEFPKTASGKIQKVCFPNVIVESSSDNI